MVPGVATMDHPVEPPGAYCQENGSNNNRRSVQQSANEIIIDGNSWSAIGGIVFIPLSHRLPSDNQLDREQQTLLKSISRHRE